MSNSSNVTPLSAVASAPQERYRQLVAVLAADAVSFTSCMEKEPAATVDAIEHYRRLMRGMAESRHGTLVDSPGDFMLLRFGSAEAAVLCGLEFLEELSRERGAGSAKQLLDFRVGAHIGDVFEVGKDILGPAVNVASRLQQLAGVNSVLVSSLVRDQLEGHSRIVFDYVGQKDLKNVYRPVQVYTARTRRDDEPVRNISRDSQGPDQAGFNRIPVTRPTITIGPLKAIDNQDTTALIAASLTEELLATLGCISGAVVVRKGDSPPPTENCFTVSGSVRMADRVRVVAEITSATSGETVWIGRYDFKPGDNFDAEERISKQVISALQVKLTEGEQAELWNARTTSLKAWENFQRGRSSEALYRRESHLAARRWYAQSIKEDENYVPAIVALGFCHIDEIRLGWCTDLSDALGLAEQQCQRAEALDMEYPGTYALRAYILFLKKDFEAALDKIRQAASIAPNNLEIVAYYGAMLDTLGRLDEAIDCYTRSAQLSLYTPAWVVSNLGLSYLFKGDIDAAQVSFESVISENREYLRAYIGLAIVAAYKKDVKGAQKFGRQILSLDPDFIIANWAKSEIYMDQERLQTLSRYLRMAGLK